MRKRLKEKRTKERGRQRQEEAESAESGSCRKMIHNRHRSHRQQTATNVSKSVGACEGLNFPLLWRVFMPTYVFVGEGRSQCNVTPVYIGIIIAGLKCVCVVPQPEVIIINGKYYIYAFSRHFYPKRLYRLYIFLSVCVFTGNRTHDILRC